ncbi:MAG: sugar phosphate isomerase/epimerase [Planctomycetes bacterium]|nr:sugar phosphate isomerase/epimerase [Planctomycetota bacterium]
MGIQLSQKELHTFGEDITGLFRFAAEQGLQGVQIHLPDEDRLEKIKAAIAETGVQVASVNAMSCAMLGPDKEKQAHEHRQVSRALEITDALGAPTVSNFAGYNYTLSMEDNAVEFGRVYADHARIAEERGLKICFENCPMIGSGTGTGKTALPRHAQNMAYCPANWRLLFAACDSPALGIEFDTSHTVYVGLDTCAVLREWKDRIHHIQIKDCKLHPHDQKEHGVLNGIPHSLVPIGEGDIDGEKLFACIQDIGFSGYITSDIEGNDIDGARRNIKNMKQLLGLAMV